MKRLSLVLALALAPALHGCATVTPRGDAVAVRSSAIPFEQAEVTRGAGDHAIRWSASGASSVTIYAGASPDTIDRTRAVATGGAAGSATVTGLAPDRRWFFALVPDRGAPLVIADRGLHLATVPNLRDLGGYRTVDGRWVRMGLIYRSDQLDRLDDRDFAALSALGLGAIADLRTATERKREPDRVPAGVEHLVLDVAADSEGSLGGDMRQAMAMIQGGRGVEMLTAANRDFVALSSARSAYRILLTRMASAGGRGLLYHCTAGKDRTGWASAVLLSLLGVPRETVMADYLASNAYLAGKNRATLAALAKSSTPLDPAKLEPVLTVRAAFIEAAFAEVDKRYGSMEAYIRDGLGIDDAMVAALKDALLV